MQLEPNSSVKARRVALRVTLRFLLAYELKKQIEVTAFDEWNCRADVACFLSSHASKMQSFFLFRKLGRLLFGEPLGGVEAPTAF